MGLFLATLWIAMFKYLWWKLVKVLRNRLEKVKNELLFYWNDLYFHPVFLMFAWVCFWPHCGVQCLNTSGGSWWRWLRNRLGKVEPSGCGLLLVLLHIRKRGLQSFHTSLPRYAWKSVWKSAFNKFVQQCTTESLACILKRSHRGKL